MRTHQPALPEGQGSLAARRWTFGSAVLDERTLELRVDDRAAPLERKTLEVLIYLLLHANEVVTKEEFLDELWTGRILTEHSLTRCISQLRKALKDDEKKLIRTAHKFGYRLVAEVAVEESHAPPTPAFQFNCGDRVPHRPQWKLVDRLGAGSHGEAWLACHTKTNELRAFKFAIDQRSLSTLKREVTLYRVLRDTLGDEAPIVRLLEWNFEELPYFTESQLMRGGSLSEWPASRGILSEVPLPMRLELAARVADAVAAVHAVGVLHKDLKPSNVLLDIPENTATGRSTGSLPTVRLADFGSGGVLDPERLEALGITKLGFTKNIPPGGGTAGTPIYLAPEVISGQPFTTKSDIYALGVMLYQLSVGDLSKSLALGWEEDIDDELIREDVAASAAGSPERRLPDAALLARLIRTLEARRSDRDAEQQTKLRAERVRQTRQTLQRTQFVAAALLILSIAAVASGITAYRAKTQAVETAATSKAISDFLLDDVLWIDPLFDRPKDEANTFLERASRNVDEKLGVDPEAAAQVHFLLGRRYLDIGDFESAAEHFASSASSFESLYGPAHRLTIESLERVAWTQARLGDLDAAMSAANRLAEQWDSFLLVDDPFVQLLRMRLANSATRIGQYKASISDLRTVLNSIPNTVHLDKNDGIAFRALAGVTPNSSLDIAKFLKAQASGYLGGILAEYWSSYKESEKLLQFALDTFEAHLGHDNILTTRSRMSLGLAQVMLGKYEDAAENLTQSQSAVSQWVRVDDLSRSIPTWMMGRLWLEQGDAIRAIQHFKEVERDCRSSINCTKRMYAKLLNDIGQTYLRSGDRSAAANSFEKARTGRSGTPAHHDLELMRSEIGLAEARLMLGQLDRATEHLTELEPLMSLQLSDHHELWGDLHRIRGLIWVARGVPDQAIQPLNSAHDIVLNIFGEEHWRTRRAADELDSARVTKSAEL